MTNTTHEAPERIWLNKDESYWENNLGIVFTFQNGSHDVEYVRADRIEELQAENKNLRHMIIDQIEGTGDDPEIMAASRAEWAARAKAAEARIEELEADRRKTYEALLKHDEVEAKLARAVEVLEGIAAHDTQAWAIKALAELTGGNDG